MKTRIHVNQHNIKHNDKVVKARSSFNEGKAQQAMVDEIRPVITVKDYKQNRKCFQANIADSDGKVVASVIYRQDKPLSCGARVWIETELEVIAL